MKHTAANQNLETASVDSTRAITRRDRSSQVFEELQAEVEEQTRKLTTEFAGKSIRSYHTDGSLLSSKQIASVKAVPTYFFDVILSDGKKVSARSIGDLLAMTNDAERNDTRAAWAENEG